MESNPSVGSHQLLGLAARAERAASLLGKDIWVDNKLQQICLIECARISVMARAHALAAEIVQGYEACRGANPEARPLETLAEAGSRLDIQLTDMDKLFLAIEEHREAYLQPHMLRELSLMREFLVKLRNELQGVAEGMAKEKVQALPELTAMHVQPVTWVG